MLLLLASITLAAAPSSGATLRFDETWPSGAPRTIAVLVDGAPVATETLDAEGNVEAVDGKIPDGLATQYGKKDPSKVLSTVTYKRNTRTGEALTWYSDGTLMRRRSYVAGKKDGLEHTFSREGLKLRSASYTEGLLDGTVTEFNDLGEPMTKTKYVAGRREGEAQEFDALGRVERVQRWKDDKEDGPPTCFKGDVVVTCDPFDDKPAVAAKPGKPKPEPVKPAPAKSAPSAGSAGGSGLVMRYVVERGVTVGGMIYLDGTRIAAELISPDSCCTEIIDGVVPDGVIPVLDGAKGTRKFSEVTYRDNARNGVTKVFRPSGELGMQLTFVNGLREGPAEEYFPEGDGAVSARFSFKQGLFEGPLTEYWRNGKPSYVAEYKRGKVVGKERFFSPDGRAISEAEWQDLKTPPPPPDEGFVDEVDDFGADTKHARREKRANGKTCAVNSECASGVCKVTTCTAPAPRGASCKWSSECASKKCHRNACW